MISFVIQIHNGQLPLRLNDLFLSKPGNVIRITDQDFEIMLWGDPITDSETAGRLKNYLLPESITDVIPGHYYYLCLDRRSERLYLGNSLFSILPLYYYVGVTGITISDNVFDIGKHLGINETDRDFILETCLFNYPLFDRTILRGVKLLPANSCFIFSCGSYIIQKHTEIADLFCDNPIQAGRSLPHLSELFLERLEKYLPPDNFACSLTGGFDGRTLVAGALCHERDFFVYSFGDRTSPDTEIAGRVAKVAGLHFEKISLDDDYVLKSSKPDGLEFIRNSSGTATFERAHYLHAARVLAGKTGFFVSGNFGSELLRAVHNPGAVVSENLYALFNEEEPGSVFRKMENSPAFMFLKEDSFGNEWGRLKEQISDLPAFNPKYRSLSKNRRFYIFVLEEIFRKYFGAEMINQYKYLRNRTPFLDIGFIRELFRSELAGIHSDFRERNPLKRYKGQLLYSRIISEAFPPLGKIKTDKGYSPDDLLSPAGTGRVAAGWFARRLKGSNGATDPNSVVKAWEQNREYWTGMLASVDYFRPLEPGTGIYTQIVSRACSLAYSSNLTDKSVQRNEQNQNRYSG